MTSAVLFDKLRLDPIALLEVIKGAGHETSRRGLRDFDIALLTKMKSNFFPLFGGDDSYTVGGVNPLHPPFYHRFTSFLE